MAIRLFDGEEEDNMSFWRLYYHLTWSTKNREPFITPEMEPRLFAYMVKKSAELEAFVYAINGWNDHVHIVAAIPPKVAVAELVKLIKGSSTHYLNFDVRLDYHFEWQRGYGALSVGERQRPIAETYVRNQKEHHSKNTTNAWLERYSDLDEGPDKPTSDTAHMIREEQAIYQISAEIPF